VRRATLRNSELFLQTHGKDGREWEERELFKGPIHTSRQIKNNLRQNLSKDKFCRVNLCDICPCLHSNYFALKVILFKCVLQLFIIADIENCLGQTQRAHFVRKIFMKSTQVSIPAVSFDFTPQMCYSAFSGCWKRDWYAHWKVRPFLRQNRVL